MPRACPRRGRKPQFLLFDELPIGAERVRQHRVRAEVRDGHVTPSSLAGHFGGVEKDHVRVRADLSYWVRLHAVVLNEIAHLAQAPVLLELEHRN